MTATPTPYYDDGRGVILHGDVLAILPTLPDESVQCCITSPPYWGLRDYGVDGQIGLEKSPEEYTAKMVEVFRHVRRVLKADGVLWLNLGDSYASGGSGQNFSSEHGSTANSTTKCGGYGHIKTQRNPKDIGLKPKDLCGIPWRVAFALQADGWYLRSDIIWHKPNPMPESVTDRPTKAHEYVFLMSKSDRYYYDAEAVAEKSITLGLKVGGIGVSWHNHEDDLKRGDRKSTPGTNGQHQAFTTGRNRRTVWTVPTSPFPDAHFATFPPDLIKPMVLAGSRPDDVVFDPFMGAGTVALVAKELNRRYLGIELNADYIRMAQKRLKQEVLAL